MARQDDGIRLRAGTLPLASRIDERVTNPGITHQRWDRYISCSNTRRQRRFFAGDRRPGPKLFRRMYPFHPGLDIVTFGDFLISTLRSSAIELRSCSTDGHRDHLLQAPEAVTGSRGEATPTEPSASQDLASLPQITQNLPCLGCGNPEAWRLGERQANSMENRSSKVRAITRSG